MKYKTHICGECFLQKKCSEEEFMEHMYFHDCLNEVLEELGMVQEESNYIIKITSLEDGES